MKSAYEISLLESRLTQFQNDKESFMNDLLKNDEELSVLKINVEKLQHEKKVLAEDIMMCDGVSSM
jgi:seryl-tRNA synthetase